MSVPSMCSGWLTEIFLLLLGRRRAALVAQVGVELVRHPGLAALADEGHVEVVDGEVERLQVVGAEEGAGPEVVVLAERVGEAVVGHHDDAALEAEQPAEREPDQHDQHRQVEQQVAGLAEVAALGAHHVVLDHQPVALPLQPGRRGLESGVVAVELAVLRQPGEVLGRLRRTSAYAARVDEQPRDDAAHQRDHQQDVDRREPHRVVDREQAELLVDRGQLGVLVLPLRRPHRVDRLLRHHRPGDRREREQEQQDQRRPHRGELAPRPAGELLRAQRRSGLVTGSWHGTQTPAV